MYPYLTKLHFTLLAIATLLVIGCAALKEKPDRFEPIATSLDQMPEEAAMVATAIQRRVAGTGKGQVQNVRFADHLRARFSQPWSSEEGFVFTGAQLYQHQASIDTPSETATSGRLDFEEPFGRRAFVRYDARYRSSEKGLVIEDARVTPLYAASPEPIMFVVPAESLPADANRIPGTYGGLLQFVAARAVDPTKPASVSMGERDYVIFVFFLDQDSPSSILHVKVSDKPSTLYGYKDTTRYVDFGGWLVAVLAGRFTLSGGSDSPPLYVKAVFTPGEEVGLFRRIPRLVGLFQISEPSP